MGNEGGDPQLLTHPESSKPRRRRGEFSPGRFDSDLRFILDEQERLHEAYGWRTETGKPRRFKVSGGTCRVALACLREGWTKERLVEGLKAICWREANADGRGPRADKQRSGAFATLSVMLGTGRQLERGKSDKLERALAAWEDAGRPEGPRESRALTTAKPKVSYGAVAQMLEEL